MVLMLGILSFNVMANAATNTDAFMMVAASGAMIAANQDNNVGGGLGAGCNAYKDLFNFAQNNGCELRTVEGRAVGKYECLGDQDWVK